MTVRQAHPIDVAVGRFTRALAAAAFLTAGLIRSLAWRRLRDPGLLFSALALAAIGLSLPVVSALGLFASPTDESMISTLTVRLSFVFVVITLGAVALVLGPTARSDRTGARSVTTGWLLVAGIGILFLGFLVRGAMSGLSVPERISAVRTAEWVATGTWVALTLAYLRTEGRRAGRNSVRGGVALTLMALAEAVHALAVTGPPGLVGASAGLQLLAALLATWTAMTCFWQVVASGDLDNEELAGDLNLVRSDLVRTQLRERDRLHDARTAIVSLMGASQILSGKDQLDQAERARLTGLMSAELWRLSGLLEDDGTSPHQDFSLAEVLQPLVFAHRMNGDDVRLEVDDSWAVGRPHATASAVANLLTNARSHAPGAAVRVRARTTGSGTVILVEDDGPGISPTELDRVNRRGFRGSTAQGAGHGIGLHSATSAMLDQGGSLDLAVRPGGGTRVMLRLPGIPVPTDPLDD